MRNKYQLEFTEKIKRQIIGMGADLVGIADLNDLRELKVYPDNLMDPFTYAISIAVQLPAAIFDMIIDKPSSIYDHFYKTANSFLDEIAFQISGILQSEGHNTLPIPSSGYVDRENFAGTISHKAVARMAGLGWQGKNLLIITPQFGSRVRLITVLTTAPLVHDSPIKNRCGDCMLCHDACPVKAIKGISTEDHYKDRDEALYFSKCVKRISENMKIPGINGMLCGICIKVCPYGQKGKGTNDNLKEEK